MPQNNLTLFCRECGHKNEYTFKKPNFCENCGNKFAHASVQTVVNQKPAPKVQEIVDEQQSEEDIVIPQITEFSFEADLETRPKVKFEQIAHTKKPSAESRGRGNGGVTQDGVKNMMKDMFSADKQRAKQEPDAK